MINLITKHESSSNSFIDYESLLADNKTKTNRYLNRALWLCSLTGPALALGILLGIFKDVSYFTCFSLSIFVLLLAFSHYIMVTRFPQSDLTSVHSLFVLDILLAYMANSHIYLRMTWFLVPILSLLFCSYRIFFISLFINYASLLFTTWLTAPFYASQRADLASPVEYFCNISFASTIETCIMAVAGFSILKTSHRFSKELFDNYQTIKTREIQISDSMHTLTSMAGIYDRVNLLDFRKMIEMPLSGSKDLNTAMDINGSNHTRMVMELKEHIAPEQLDSFLKFTDLTTLRKRLLDEKSISGEFINISSGWFRAQYITVENNSDGVPIRIIFTVQNIEKDKRKEEKLLWIAMTDELTHLFNRRSYYDDINIYKEKGMDDIFTLLSADVNGLKVTNDTKGHAAGDELIKGAAECLLAAVGDSGKVYRTGGDEFIALLHVDDCREIVEVIKSKAKIWHGQYIDSISISIGFASHKDYPDASIDELERISDQHMYEDKENYYMQKGIDRRKKR